MASVADVLAHKGSRVHAIPPTATVLEATQLMNRLKIGALVVTRSNLSSEEPSCSRVVGMFTERDVLSRIVAQQRNPITTLVEEVMTTEVAYCSPETDLDDVAAVMRERRIRHFPVCDGDGGLRGLISIGDLNAWNAQGQEAVIHHLHDYIYGRV